MTAKVADPYIAHHDQSFIVELHGTKPLHVSVATVRRDNLPFLEHGGTTSVLPLPQGDNLAEPTHLVFFAKRIVAMVRSQMTPGHITSAYVLSARCGLDLMLAPIVRPEIEALVMNSLAVTNLEMRVAGSSFNRASADAGDPVEAVRLLTDKFSGAGRATVSLAASSKPDRQRFRHWLIRKIQAGEISGHHGVDMARATVIDRDGQRQVVDLLEDQIAHKVTVQTLQATRYVDPVDVIRVVLDSFEEQKGVLTRAIELHGD